jgi:hypothetical protein
MWRTMRWRCESRQVPEREKLPVVLPRQKTLRALSGQVGAAGRDGEEAEREGGVAQYHGDGKGMSAKDGGAAWLKIGRGSSVREKALGRR